VTITERRRKSREGFKGQSRALKAPPKPAAEEGTAGWLSSDRRLALVLALLALLVYNANFRLIAAGDSYPARFLPFALWNHGTLYLDPVREVAAQRNPNPYWIRTTPGGRSASLYPVVAPLLASPLYLPAALWVREAGETYERMSWAGSLLEKLAASAIAAAAVGWMFLLLRRRLERRGAILLTLVFAFATSTWATSSQALWQHGPAELFVVGTLWFLTGDLTRGNLLAAGALAGLMAANRPPDLLLTAAFGIYALLRARRQAAGFMAAAAVPALLAAAYNLIVFRRLGGGYSSIDLVGGGFFSHSLLAGAAGLLVSPGRGLLIYSPFFVFLPLCFRRVLAAPDTRVLTLCLTAGVLLQLALYAVSDWRAGFSYGCRFLTDLVPILIWMLAPVPAALGRPARAAFLAGCLLALWAQIVGAFMYTGISDLVLNAPADEKEMRNVWKLADAPILVEARQGVAPFDLLRQAMSPP
jgi:hypothetical protein